MKVQTVLPTFFLLTNLSEEPWRLVASLTRCLADFELEEVVPSYESIGIYFSVPVSESAVRQALESFRYTSTDCTSRRHSIPVCYEYGPDLAEVSTSLDCSIPELIEIHSMLVFRCMAMGFSPGFGYLRPLEEGPLPKLWTLPRLASPRKVVPAGSVAITGRQAAVYPQATPGGWRLIGRTPIKMADLNTGEFRLRTGDEVTFHAIGADRFGELWEAEHGEPFRPS